MSTDTAQVDEHVVGGQAPKRRIGYGILDALSGLPLFATAPLSRHWYVRWGATDDEVRSSMPGDEIIAQASLNATRAITIDASPEHVWPWIIQMGYRRAGFYTYDLIDNDGYPSADCVLEEYQHIEVGDWAFPMNGLFGLRFPLNETTAFKVKAFETNQWLLWEKPGSTWAWLLKPLPGSRTRLISRQKAHYPEPFTMILMEFGDPPMVRRVLKGIKARAERIGSVQESTQDCRESEMTQQTYDPWPARTGHL